MSTLAIFIKEWIQDPERSQKVIVPTQDTYFLKDLERTSQIVDWLDFLQNLSHQKISSFSLYEHELLLDCLGSLKAFIPQDTRSWFSQVIATERPEEEYKLWKSLYLSIKKAVDTKQSQELDRVLTAYDQFNNSLIACRSEELNQSFQKAYKEAKKLEDVLKPLYKDMEIADKSAFESFLSHIKSWRIEVLTFHQIVYEYTITVFKESNPLSFNALVLATDQTLDKLQAAHLIQRVEDKEDLKPEHSPFKDSEVCEVLLSWCHSSTTSIVYKNQPLQEYLPSLLEAEHKKRDYTLNCLFNLLRALFPLADHHVPHFQPLL